MARDRRLSLGSPRRGVVAVGVGLWTIAYGWPLLAILSRSATGVAGREGLGASSLSVLWDDRTLRLAGVTFTQTAVSVVVVCALGIPLGWVLARLEFPGRRLASAVVMVPFVLPTLTIASAVVAMMGAVPTSTPARFVAIIAAHACLNLGVMVRAVGAAVAAVPVSVEHSARTLGRGPVRSVTETTLTMIRPQIRQAALVVAMFCLTSFGVIVALGGNRLATVEVEVWYLSTRALDLGRAAVLVLAQLIVVAALVAPASRSARRLSQVRSVAAGLSRRRRPNTRTERVAALCSLVIVAVVALGPLAALATRSLQTPHGWGLSNYRGLFWPSEWTGPAGARPLIESGDVIRALSYSVGGALVAMALALCLAVPFVAAGQRRVVDRMLLVPMSISAATLGLGFLLAYSTARIDLRGSWIVVPLVQAVTAAPVAARLLVGSVRAIDTTPWEAAAVLGAGPWRRFVTIAAPLLRRPVAVAAGFAFAMAIGEFGATVFLARNDRPTIPILISRLLGRPGETNFGAAMALSFVLAAIVLSAVVLVDRRASGDIA